MTNSSVQRNVFRKRSWNNILTSTASHPCIIKSIYLNLEVAKFKNYSEDNINEELDKLMLSLLKNGYFSNFIRKYITEPKRKT